MRLRAIEPTSGAGAIGRTASHRPAEPTSPGSGHVTELDGIRGLAILLVIQQHYLVELLPPLAGWLGIFQTQVLALSWSGVDLFFVLSGFLIGGILMDQRETPNYFKAFYARRATRILPLYFAWLAVSVLLALWAAGISSAVSPVNFLSNPLTALSFLTLTQNIPQAYGVPVAPAWLSITWSLAVEEQFYLTLPLLVRIVPPRKLPLVLVSLIALAPLCRTAVLYLPPHSTFAAYVLMPCRADTLLLGVLCAFLVRRPGFVASLKKHTAVLYLVLLVALAALEGLRLGAGSPAGEVAFIAFGYTLLAVFYCALLLMAWQKGGGIVPRVARLRWLGKLGVIAYGVYLIHLAPLLLGHALLLHHAPALDSLGSVAVTLGALCLSLLLAQASWQWFEKPLVAWGRMVQYVSPPIAPAPPVGLPATTSKETQ